MSDPYKAPAPLGFEKTSPDPRITRANKMLILFALVILTTSFVAARNQPRGSELSGILLYCLPVGAFVAGTQGYKGICFLIYGGVGTLILVLHDVFRQGWRVLPNPGSNSSIFNWMVYVVGMVLLPRLAGQTAWYLSRLWRSELPPADGTKADT